MHMLFKQSLPLLTVLFLTISSPSWALLAIPGADGTDGAYEPTENEVIDLSLAPTAAWDSAGNGDGVYDPDKWAVVFKFTSVNIPAGVTVSFTNHISRAPVVWLVSGDVDIAGTLTLRGDTYVTQPASSEPGPGGFGGGKGYGGSSSPSGGGFGIGGAANTAGQGGSHATAGVNNTSPTYGNLRVLPLVGGSGGGGDVDTARGGAAGGGALLLAVAGTLSIDGLIDARGGNGLNSASQDAGAGAGGAIRLIAETVRGSGRVLAVGGATRTGGEGRNRIEALNAISSWDVQPVTNVVAPDEPVLLWLPDGAPTVEITSIAETTPPADPHARMELGQEDIVLPTLGGDADILLQTNNVDPTATVQVRITPEYGAPSFADATFDSGTLEQATWRATATLPPGYFTVQAHAVNP